MPQNLKLIKSSEKASSSCGKRTTILISEDYQGDPFEVLTIIFNRKESGQLIFHLGTGGGVGRIEFKQEQKS
jgi:hypothetical protein